MNDTAQFHRRLSVQLSVTVALVTSLAFGFTVWFVADQERKTLTNELILRLLSESRSLSLAAAQPLLRHDPELGLHPLIVRALEDTQDLTDLVVLDSQRRVQGHRDVLQVGQEFQIDGQRQPLDLEIRDGEQVWLNEAGQIVIDQSIFHVQRHIGHLVMWASRDGIEATVRAAQTRLMLVGGAGTLLAILSVFVLVNLNLQPLAALRRGVQRLGAGDLDARVVVRSRNELGMFAHLVNSMASGLQEAQTELIQKERLDHELRIAHDLQKILLPRDIRPAPGYDIEAHYTPALEVSGDYYDTFPLDDHHMAVVAADVSGKGVPGLVIMAMLRTCLRSLAEPDRDPKDVLVSACHMLRGSMGRGMFVTCLYGVLDSRTHTLTYASAGHCPPLSFGPHGATFLPAGGKPIGLFPVQVLQQSIVTRTATLQPGDGLLLYTDGLVESMNVDGEQLGNDPVLQLLQSLGAEDAPVIEPLLQLVDAHRRDHPASDDLTLLAVRRQAASKDVEAPSKHKPVTHGMLEGAS